MKKDLIAIVLLTFLSFPAAKDLFLPGAYSSHDLTHHIVRQIDMDQLLAEGQLPPRWSGELNHGFGYPLFLFNYPLPPILGEPFYHLFGAIWAVKLLMVISLPVSAIGMYLFLKSLTTDKLAAILGSIFYLYAPYRFVVVYVSAALGSAVALAILPLIFWSIVKVCQGDKRFVLIGSLAVAGLISSHNVTTLMFTPVIILFALLFSGQKITQLKSLSLMLLLGIGLTTFFWLPAALEKQFIVYDSVMPRFYADHFPSFLQLLRSPWGYGLSNKGVLADGMSFQIGLAQILVMLLALPAWWMSRKDHTVRIWISFALVIFVGSVLIMLEFSLPVWDNLPLLGLVQFPWRFLSVSVFACAVAAAMLVKVLPQQKVAVFTLILLALYANRNHWHINERLNNSEVSYHQIKTTTTAFNEHLPLLAKPQDHQSPGKLEFIKGRGEITYLQNRSTLVLAEVEASRSAAIRFNQYYFPGWQFRIDGYPTQINYQLPGDSLGLPVLDIEAGRHQITAAFKRTPIRRLADVITLAVVAGWLMMLLMQARKDMLG